MADNDVQITITTKIDSLTAAINQANRQIQSLKQRADTAGKSLDAMGKAGGNSHSTVSSIQAASAALREFNGDISHNIRAVERFITTIPGVGNALKAAFPLVGGLAFGAMIFDLGEKIYDFAQKALNAPRDIEDGFATLSVSTQSTNDALELTNVKLENQIAKLEHKPQNALAESFAELKVQADKSAESLDAVYNKVKALLEQNKIGAGAAIFTNQIGTASASGTVNSFNRQLAELGNKRANAISANNPKLTAEIDKQIADTKAAARKNYTQGLAYSKQPQKNLFGQQIDTEGNISIYSSGLSELDAEDRGEKLQTQNAAGTKKVDQLRAQKELADAQREDARRVSEAQKQAQEKQKEANQQLLADFRSGLDDQKATFELSKSQEAEYWDTSAAIAARGGSYYAKAFKDSINEANKVIASINAETVRLNVKISDPEEISKLIPEQDDTVRDRDYLKSESQGDASYLADSQKAGKAGDEQSDAFRAQQIQLKLSQGLISRYDAAQQLADLHTGQFAEQLGALDATVASLAERYGLAASQLTNLQSAQAALNSRPDLPGEAKDQIVSAVGDRDTVRSNQAAQAVQDNVELDDTKLTSAWQSSMNRFVQQSRDTAKQIGNIFSDSLESVNSSFSTALTGQYRTSRERDRALRNGLSEGVRGEGAKLANAGLQKAEGSALSLFGFGGSGSKADGSAQNPWWVKIAGGVAKAESTAQNAATGLASRIPGLSRLFSPKPAPTFNAGGLDPLNLVPPSTSNINLSGGSGAADITKQLASLFPSLSSDSAKSAIGGGLADAAGDGGSVVDALGNAFQGFFANGGDVVANRPAIIGERGPEIFMPRTAGSIVPNHQIGSFGGTTHNHYTSIDARNANDPAAVDQAARRAVAQMTPSFVAHGLRQQAEHQKRIPSSRR